MPEAGEGALAWRSRRSSPVAAHRSRRARDVLPGLRAVAQAEAGLAKSGSLVKNERGRRGRESAGRGVAPGGRQVRPSRSELGLDDVDDRERPAVAVELVTRRELAARLGVHMQTVTKWEREGLPIAERGRRGRPSRMTSRRFEGVARGAGVRRRLAGSPFQRYQAAHARQRSALAELAELQLEERRGRLIDAQVVHAKIVDVFTVPDEAARPAEQGEARPAAPDACGRPRARRDRARGARGPRDHSCLERSGGVNWMAAMTLAASLTGGANVDALIARALAGLAAAGAPEAVGVGRREVLPLAGVSGRAWPLAHAAVSARHHGRDHRPGDRRCR
jgi:hypothetical protein